MTTIDSYTATQQKIWQAALDLIANNGYKATTTKQIAAAADINESTLFKNFDNKLQLFNEIIRYESDAFIIEINSLLAHDYTDLANFVTKNVQSIYQIFLKHHKLVTILLRELDSPELMIANNSIFECTTNALTEKLAKITQKSAESFVTPAFMLLSSLMCLVINQTNSNILTDDLSAPVTVQQITNLTLQMLQAVCL